MMGAVVHP